MGGGVLFSGLPQGCWSWTVNVVPWIVSGFSQVFKVRFDLCPLLLLFIEAARPSLYLPEAKKYYFFFFFYANTFEIYANTFEIDDYIGNQVHLAAAVYRSS